MCDSAELAGMPYYFFPLVLYYASIWSVHKRVQSVNGFESTAIRDSSCLMYTMFDYMSCMRYVDVD